MKYNYFFALFFSSGLLCAQLPITLGNTNMPGNGDTLRYTNVLLSSVGNYTQTGTNFSWNFGSVVSAGQGLRTFKSALQTPYAFLFLSLNEYGEKIADTLGIPPFIITQYYNFYKKSTSPNAFIADGAGVTFTGIPIPSYYTDKDELYNFPMTYPKYDSTTFRFATPSTTLIPVRYSKTGYRVTRVDGWGTVTTPYGTENCLRLVTTQYSKDTVKTTIGSITIPIGIPNNARSYQWMTLNSKIPYMEVSGSLIGGVFTPTQARYRGYPMQYTYIAQHGIAEDEITLFPNPVKDRLWISYRQSATLCADVYDALGKPVMQAEMMPGSTGQWLDVSAMPPGLYVVKIAHNGKAECLKFIKN